MFDDLRNESQSSQFSDDEIENLFEPKAKKRQKSLKIGSRGKIFGMTAVQRFILSFLLLSVSCLGGVILLLFTGRIVIIF
jgi:hypothetical protein